MSFLLFITAAAITCRQEGVFTNRYICNKLWCGDLRSTSYCTVSLVITICVEILLKLETSTILIKTQDKTFVTRDGELLKLHIRVQRTQVYQRQSIPNGVAGVPGPRARTGDPPFSLMARCGNPDLHVNLCTFVHAATIVYNSAKLHGGAEVVSF